MMMAAQESARIVGGSLLAKVSCEAGQPIMLATSRNHENQTQAVATPGKD